MYRYAPRQLLRLALPSVLLFAGCAAPQRAGPSPGAAVLREGGRSPAAPEVIDDSRRACRGVWITPDELAALPCSGRAWEALERAARSRPEAPDLTDQDQRTNVVVLAKALVAVRTGSQSLREEVIDLCLQAVGTEKGARSLAVGRELPAYIFAADLVGLPEPEAARFSGWLRTLLDTDLRGRSLRSTQEDRPNNWGTHAGAARAAIAVYLDDEEELERCAQVFRGWLGDRSAYSEFRFGDLSWQHDPQHPVGINPVGSERDGHSIDGAQPEEMRRGGPCRFPPAPTGYAWEALQGACVLAEILHRSGRDAWTWQDNALSRAVRFLYSLPWPAEGDDLWLLPLINRRTGSTWPEAERARPGKNAGWTDWTHGSGAGPSSSVPAREG